MSREELVKQYFEEDYSYQEIIDLLKNHGINISYRHLQRILQSLALRRKYRTEDLNSITQVIIEELKESGSCLGYKSLCLRLKRTYGLSVYRKTVEELLHILDPEGIELRSKYKLKRRIYSVPGPNFIWHIDGYDKLKPFGFAIHGAVDGFSRRIIWLELATTNNKPTVICYYYLKTARELKKIPTLIRSDKGTENTIVDTVHQALRSDDQDSLAGINSFLKGKSTANQRIESTWMRLRRQCFDFWINFFKDMRDCKHFDKSDAVQVECLRFCFGPLIKYDLEKVKNEWNQHTIRKQKTINVQGGRPNHMFFAPMAYKTVDYGYTVKDEHIENAQHNFAEKPSYCSSSFNLLVQELFPNFEMPVNIKEAILLYHKILMELKKYD